VLSSFNPHDHLVNLARLAIVLCCYLCLPLLGERRLVVSCVGGCD
jgi:hypothetical protein